MNSNLLRLVGVLVSLGSAAFGIYWVIQFARSSSPDSSLLVAPLFFAGLPLTFVGNLIGVVFQMVGREVWYGTIPTIICYFVQWQLVAWWFYRRGAYADGQLPRA